MIIRKSAKSLDLSGFDIATGKKSLRSMVYQRQMWEYIKTVSRELIYVYIPFSLSRNVNGFWLLDFSALNQRSRAMASQGLPESFQVVAVKLQPYIHNRNDARQTRNLIASHLKADSNFGDTLSRPLSLVETHHVRTSSYESQSLYKDYLKALNSNLVARDAYDSVVIKNTRPADSNEPRRAEQTTLKASFVRLTRSQQKYERLNIIHEHVDKLSEQNAASEQSRQLSTMPNLDAMPSIPSAVLSVNDQATATSGDLHQLTLSLEKAVLKAKRLLKREQKILAKIRSEHTHPLSSPKTDSKIRALASTRNELISWMESELSKEDVDEGDVSVNQEILTSDIPSKLEMSAALYGKYSSLRSGILNTMAEEYQPATIPTHEADLANIAAPETHVDGQYPTAPLLTYLEQVVSMSNEQKAITQQKSHMALGLSKYNKVMGQMLDRQAEESHILSSHRPLKPQLNKLHKGVSPSFAEEMSASGHSNSLQQAQLWADASAIANRSMKETVSGHLEDGGSALLDAQETLLGLLELGNDLEAGEQSCIGGPDIWKGIDGKLGVI